MKKQIKLWAELIKSEKLEEVLKDIQMYAQKDVCMQLDSQTNKYIFKLLLTLSCGISRFSKQDYMLGQKIAELTKLFCSLLIEIPDSDGYIGSLYNIIRFLISLKLYKDATDICYYLQSWDLHGSEKTTEFLTKLLFLWHTSYDSEYDILTTTKSFSIENYDNLKDIIRYEFEMVQIVYKNHTKQLITRISKHITKFSAIGKEASTYFNDFYEYMLGCLTSVQLHLDKDEKYEIYCHIHCIISHVLYNTIVANYTEAMKVSNELFNHFEDLLAEDEECRECFQQFRSICSIILIPVDCFTSDTANDIKDYVRINQQLTQKYGYTECLQWNVHTIAFIIKPLFLHWRTTMETSVEASEQRFLNTGVLLETMKFIQHVCVFFVKKTLNKCRSCINKKCTIKYDIHSSVVIKLQLLHLMKIFSKRTLPKEVCVLARRMLEQIVALIHEMRQHKCNIWMKLWPICSQLMYIMGAAFEHIYDDSVRVYSLLCACIYQFEEIKVNSKNLLLVPENSLSYVLYKLSVVHNINGAYRKAMTTIALSALLACDQPKAQAFYFWANIKKRCTSQEIAKLTMLQCLRNDKAKIHEMGLMIDISKYDLALLCMHEAKSLLLKKIPFADGVSMVLEELRNLKPDNHEYAHVIYLLGYYLLDPEHEDSVLEYYERALSNLKRNKSNVTTVLCVEANLKFFIFVEELRTMNRQTNTEMQNTMYGFFNSSKFSETKSLNIVPSYTMINIKKDSSLVLNLRESLKKWKQLFESAIDEIIRDWEPNLILRILITAGEYSRLYRYEDCEAEAWILAYKLASKIDNYQTIIYVTGRSISFRRINYDWISTAKQYAIKYKDSSDINLITAIAIFWINLADFYFECGKDNDAEKLLTEAQSFPAVSSFTRNISIYVLNLDTIIRNCNLYKNNIQQDEYSSYIVQSLYAMITLAECLQKKEYEDQANYLFDYDVLFTTTINLSIRVNSLLSFREISCHLVRRVREAQSLGAIICTAELLKSLCYIDLLRSKLDDCEVKLQGLEHILDIETFQISMSTKVPETSTTCTAITPVRITDPVRDVQQCAASPILGQKIFDLPKFALHVNCDCYQCGNMSYRYMVFATTYIRAQLYALHSNNTLAFDHFQGAFQIWQKLYDEKSILPDNHPRSETGINATSRQQDTLDIMNLAINICRKYKLEGHPLYASVKELTLDNDFQQILKSSDYLKFTVPQPHDIDTSDYTVVSTVQNICITPAARIYQTKKPLSVRRKKKLMFLKSDELSDEEDYDTSSPPITYMINKPNSVNIVAKKNLDKEPLDDAVTPFSQNYKSKKFFTTRRKRDPLTLNWHEENDKEDAGVSSLSPDAHSNTKPKSRTRLIRRKILQEDWDSK